MALEIEDKFLVISDDWREEVEETTLISQTYLITTKIITVRTRLETNRNAILCVKLRERNGGTPEYEWRMPRFLAKWFSKWSTRTLKKQRHRVPLDELTIEVDEFLGNLTGLVLAEVELPQAGHQYKKPKWFGKNVTRDKRYKNALLVKFGLPS